jgi:hypothetical protein
MKIIPSEVFEIRSMKKKDEIQKILEDNIEPSKLFRI